MQNTFENGVYYTPGSKVLIYFIVTRTFPTIVIFAIIGVALSFLEKFIVSTPSVVSMLPFPATQITSIGEPLVIAVAVVLILITCISAWLEYQGVRFMFDEFAFHVEHGIVSKGEIAIPYRQVQNVNHEQSINEKMWGIAHVIVETAGTQESQASESGDLPILDNDTALALQNELLKRASGK